MSRTKITFHGVGKFIAHMEKLQTASDTKVGHSVKKHGAGLQQKEMRAVPVDTGFLKRSILLTMSDGGLTATVEPTANYAAYVEYGTRFQRAQPYIRPSYEKQVDEFTDEMKEFWK